MTGARRTASGAHRKGPILLLVLRDEAIRTRFAQALVADGHLVLGAEDWSAGLAKALTLAPDIIAWSPPVRDARMAGPAHDT